MKKLFFLFITAIVLAACACDPINPPEPPPVKIKQFTVTVNVIGGHGTVSPLSLKVDSGKYATFKVTPDNGYLVDTIKVNNVVISTTLNCTFAVNSDKNVDVSFKFKYDEGTIEWYFTQFVWVESSHLCNFRDGDIWYDYTDDSTKMTYWYDTDGKYDALRMGVIYKDTSLSWSLDKTTDPITLVTGGKDLSKVEFIDSTKMVLVSLDHSGVINKITYTNDGVRRFK